MFPHLGMFSRPMCPSWKEACFDVLLEWPRDSSQAEEERAGRAARAPEVPGSGSKFEMSRLRAEALDGFVRAAGLEPTAAVLQMNLGLTAFDLAATRGDAAGTVAENPSTSRRNDSLPPASSMLALARADA